MFFGAFNFVSNFYALIVKNDIQIQEDVMEQLKCELFLDAAEIGVTVNKGIVTLSGQVGSYTKKLVAEKTTKKVAGVKAIAEDMHIGVSPGYKRTDAEIAVDVLSALKSHTMIPENKTIEVVGNWVKLRGKVRSLSEKEDAEKAAWKAPGVTGIESILEIEEAEY